jgi:hypothetical protein
MPEFTIRPLASNGQRILAEDIVVAASTALSAKMQVEMSYPNCYEYKIIDTQEIMGWAAIQRDREKRGFGM